ncbi:MAG: hypothetical protein ACFFC7_00565 [Candidatus Hermodarchaeota archaeon]
MEKRSETNISQILAQKGIIYSLGESVTEVEQFLNQTEAFLDDVNENLVSLNPFGVEFLKGSHFLLNAELAFLSGRADVALKFFQNAQKQLTNLVESSRNANLNDSLFLYEMQRRLIYSQARVLDSQALVLFAKEEFIEAEKQFQKAANMYNQEMEYERTNWDFQNIYTTMRNFCLTYGFVFYSQAKEQLNQDLKKARDLAYKSLNFFKKAMFLGSEIAKKKSAEIKKEITDLLFTRFEQLFEALYAKGLEHAVDGENFLVSHEYFQKGTKICEGLLKIQRKVEYELQEHIFRVSAYESYAKFLLQEDKTLEAAQTFQQAVNASIKIRNLLERWRMEALINQFETQEQYFVAMKVFAEGLGFFDKEKAEDAVKAFESAKTTLQQSLTEAKSSGNMPLVESCESAIKQIESYLETARVLTNTESILESSGTEDLFESLEVQNNLETDDSGIEIHLEPNLEENKTKTENINKEKPKKEDEFFDDLFEEAENNNENNSDLQ